MASQEQQKLDHWLDQLATEILLSEPGSDRTQFPIRDILANIRDKSQSIKKYANLHPCAAYATEFVEEIMFSNRPFSADDLAKLTELSTELKELRKERKRKFRRSDKIDLWLTQVDRELAVAQPGSDGAQFPLRDLLANLRDKSADVSGASQFNECAAFATEYVEEIMFSNQPFTAEHLERLRTLQQDLFSLRADPELAFHKPGWAMPLLPDFGAMAKEEEDTDSAEDEPAFVDEFHEAEAAVFHKPVSAPVVPAIQAESTAPAETTIVINLGNDGDLLREFASESREHLENIEQGVLVLEEQPEDADTLNSIFRAFHTFKGGSGFLHLVPVNRLSHELENLLDLARQGKLCITSPIINLILSGADLLKLFLNELEAQLDCRVPVTPIDVPAQDLIRKVQAVIADPHALDQEAPSEAAPALPVATVEAAVLAADHPAAAVDPSKQAGGGHAIKVDTAKFDSLVDLVGELVIAQSMVAQDPDMAGVSSPRLNRNMSQLGRITRELQKIAMSLRMVPIRGSFQKMNRLVRDLTTKVSKKVELKMVGEDTEMDRTIVEELSDPLMHMIRNSIDHGIESPDARTAAGKPAHGTVTLSAGHQGGNIVIEIRDDGAGLRADKLLAKAIERGVVPADAQMNEKEIFNLIFAPGFSTADKITDISGRGVGMDVVKRNIAKLRGKIEIESVVGQGTTFKIFLPLTLAIIDGLVVRVGDQRYILPTLSVRESFRPTKAMLSTVHEKGEMVNVRGHLSPILRLHEYFSIPPKTTDPTEAILIVVESAHEERCVMVDELIGKQEVVIKSLGEQFKSNRALAGAAILGDGRVGLILEPRTLVQLDGEREAA